MFKEGVEQVMFGLDIAEVFYKMFKKMMFFVFVFVFVIFSLNASAAPHGSGLTIKSVYYCGEGFSMLMSNNERWVVLKSAVGEQKMNHFISMALFMVANDFKTANVFPKEPVSWCGNEGVRPIHNLSFIKYN